MPLMRSEKNELIEQYRDGLAQAPHAFLVDFKGVDANEVTDLRAKIRLSGGSYEVVKNRLARRAIDGQALDALQDQFVGPTAVAYCTDDPVGLAKALTEFAKTVPSVEFKGGIVDGSAITAEQVQDIAKMPSREDLMAKLLFLLQSPITRLARTLAAIPRDFVVVLDQISQGKSDT